MSSIFKSFCCGLSRKRNFVGVHAFATGNRSRYRSGGPARLHEVSRSYGKKEKCRRRRSHRGDRNGGSGHHQRRRAFKHNEKTDSGLALACLLQRVWHVVGRRGVIGAERGIMLESTGPRHGANQHWLAAEIVIVNTQANKFGSESSASRRTSRPRNLSDCWSGDAHSVADIGSSLSIGSISVTVTGRFLLIDLPIET